MSEVYEGVIVRADHEAVIAVFGSLRSAILLRLTLLAPEVYGVYRPPTEGRLFASDKIEHLAEQLSATLGSALAVFYDNRCGIATSLLYSDGHRVREFGEADAIWAPLDEEGYPIPNGPFFSGDQVPDDIECDCLRSAIDAGLAAIGVEKSAASDLKQYFSYEEASWIAELPEGGSKT